MPDWAVNLLAALFVLALIALPVAGTVWVRSQPCDRLGWMPAAQAPARCIGVGE